ncbi:DNA-directed RNA polymerase specialized sigma24 family protein [Arthrobacter sp. CAN_A212]
MGGQSYEDIAETLEISTDSVRGRLSRARTTLMKEMEDWR